MARKKHALARAPANSLTPPNTDLTALVRAPRLALKKLQAACASMPGHLQFTEPAAGLWEWTQSGGDWSGRQWLYGPRRDLVILVSALNRIPALQYTLWGSDILVLELRLNGFPVRNGQMGEAGRDLSLGGLTYFPRGASLHYSLPIAGSLYAIKVIGTLSAIQLQWGLGLALLRALGHTAASLRRCSDVIRKPWQITPAATDLLRDVLGCPARDDVGQAYLAARSQQLLCESLFALTEVRPVANLPNRTRDLMYRARAILEGDPAKHHTLSSLARSLGLNRTLLAESFRAEFGETVFSFLQKERLRRAWSLLKTPGHGVASVAAQVGYRNATSFTRAFKTHYGITPRHVARTGTG